MAELAAWFTGRIPDGWFTGAPEVKWDREEILVTGDLPDVELAADATDEARKEARLARIKRFREETRRRRMAIADEAQRRFGGKVAWGARCGDIETVFTNLSVPVMTRLRMPERRVLDTLVESGVARSRSEALAWCVRLVGRNESEWIGELRDALVHVERVRAEGPTSA
ncbi:MAG: hypothetical protein ACRDLB_02195 [Actinomycetota bacterium]